MQKYNNSLIRKPLEQKKVSRKIKTKLSDDSRTVPSEDSATRSRNKVGCERGFTMQKRQFVDKSKEHERRVEEIIGMEIGRILRKRRNSLTQR